MLSYHHHRCGLHPAASMLITRVYNNGDRVQKNIPDDARRYIHAIMSGKPLPATTAKESGRPVV